MAKEEAENNEEMDEHEEDDGVSDFSEDDKVTPWGDITDDAKTPGGTATPGGVMNKIEDEVWMVAFDYNVMTYRQYGDDIKHTLSNTNQSEQQDSERNRLINTINNSFDMADQNQSDSMGIGASPIMQQNPISKKGSVQPFDIAPDTIEADASTRFQGRETTIKEQERLRKAVRDLEEANRQQEI